MPRKMPQSVVDAAFTHRGDEESNEEWQKAFRARQEEDLNRRQNNLQPHRRLPFHKRYADDATDDEAEEGADSSGEEAWRNREGERLEDFGVEKDVEFYDEEEVPLGKLLRLKESKNR